MDVLLVEPWFGGSHRQWAEGLAAHSRHDVTLLTMPDQAWKWRMRGAALTLARQVDHSPDIVLASSLLDLASFLGHTRHLLADTPVALYMHENQLTYPVPEGTKRDTSLALINWNSMAAADRVAFNSEYHQRVWFDAIRPLLSSFPGPSHSHLVDGVVRRSCVLPVGVDLAWTAGSRRPRAAATHSDALDASPEHLIVWNQRWEHDKNPDAVARILIEVADARPATRFALCGENPHGATPQAFSELARHLGDRLEAFGHLRRIDYERLLTRATIVVSAADHEFFGVAVVEAMAAGAVPVLPKRLAYPELVDDRLPMWTRRDEAVGLVLAVLDDPALWRERSAAAAQLGRRFSWLSVAPDYDDLLERLRSDRPHDR